MSEVMTGVFIVWNIAFSCVFGLLQLFARSILSLFLEILDIRKLCHPLLI